MRGRAAGAAGGAVQPLEIPDSDIDQIVLRALPADACSGGRASVAPTVRFVSHGRVVPADAEEGDGPSLQMEGIDYPGAPPARICGHAFVVTYFRKEIAAHAKRRGQYEQ